MRPGVRCGGWPGGGAVGGQGAPRHNKTHSLRERKVPIVSICMVIRMGKGPFYG